MEEEQELHPPDLLISTSLPLTVATVAPPPLPDPHQLDSPSAAATTKRQRRPSVRLGEIGGDPTYEPHPRRTTNKSWRFHIDPSFAAKSSKTRALTNLVNGGADLSSNLNFNSSAEPSHSFADFAQRKPKFKKRPKRARTNWNKFDLPISNNGGGDVTGEGLIESSGALQDENGNNNDEFRELEPEGSESPLLKEQQSPVNSVENMGLHYWDQLSRGNRGANRVSESNGVLHNEINSRDEKRSAGSVEVREWLNGLGLSRYSPFFEIHEVDDEVLPLLTLEDLKDMGINAVGSRRKMYSSILKLRKGFSVILHKGTSQLLLTTI